MRRLLCYLSLTLLLFSCKKDDNTETPIDYKLSGRYIGTFNRTGMDTVQVEFFFKENGIFEGTGGPLNYPAICGGQYEQTGNNLSVNDTCAWTANFDWTLIFDGNYTLDFNSQNEVRIWRSAGTGTDEYILNRFTR